MEHFRNMFGARYKDKWKTFAQCVFVSYTPPTMPLRLAHLIFLFLALMDLSAILALLPGADVVSDQANLSDDSDAGADVVFGQGSNQTSVSDRSRLRVQRKHKADRTKVLETNA